jgi:Pyruvate/2-oxoacid:ferredoxin oxidoreductase delta subunit
MGKRKRLRFPLFSKATRAFFRAGRRLPDYNFSDKVHGYFYGRWTYLYIGIGKGDHPWAKRLAPLFRLFSRPDESTGSSDPNPIHSVTIATGTLADGYHGKTLPLETARQLVLVNEPIHVPDLEQVIPYVRARSIILENPDHIVVLDCPCRKFKENPCLPMDVCLIVGEPFASFVSETHPDSARWITREEAIRILEEEDARGHVHHAFFKDAMLGRFYAICNCCACCCGAMGAHKNGTPMLASSGYIAVVDAENCIGCRTCEEYCQFGALSLDRNGVMVVNSELCMGCAVCESKCPEEGIYLIPAPEKGIPLEIDKLMQAALQASMD